MAALFIWGINFRVRLSKLMERIEEIIEITRTTAGTARDFTERTIKSVETFKKNIFTFETARKIITETIRFIKNNSLDGEKRS